MTTQNTATNTVVSQSGEVAYKALPRFFVPLNKGISALPAEMTLECPDLAHQAKSVLRMKPGDELILVSETDETLYHAKLTGLEKKSMAVCLMAVLPNTHQSLPAVTLGAGVLKGQRWDWLIQKATELGVKTIAPLTTRYTVVKVEDGEKKQTRWQTIAKEAAEQCEGLFIPQVQAPTGLETFVKSVSPESVKLLLLERGEDRKPLNRVLPDCIGLPHITVAIGPEGGWHDDEVALFIEAGFQPVSLGDRILRSETAVTAFLSAVLYHWDGRA